MRVSTHGGEGCKTSTRASIVLLTVVLTRRLAMKKLVILVAMAFALSCAPFAFAADTAAPADQPAMGEKAAKKVKKTKKAAKKVKKEKKDKKAAEKAAETK
jgi:hypothetical protein